MKNIKKGDIISGSLWPEPVVVNISEHIGNYIHIIGATKYSDTHIDQMVSIEELEKISIYSNEFYFTEDAEKVFLSLETIRYRYASLYDPLLAINISKVDPLPHQIEAVYGYILKYPRIRFLIADDPGAGKTIMAGLVIKELKFRQRIKRILIVVPGHLRDQWRRELKERFDEAFEVINRTRFDNEYRTNIWEKENQIITSMDFAKKKDILQTLSATHFDLIIVDEAHKMSAYKYGSKIDKSDRYKLGETLSNISQHLIFLTATPHKGDPENFRLFLDLLEKGFFATDKLISESITNRDNPLFIRRIKENLRDFEGKPLFLPRYVKTIQFDLGTSSPKEKELYNKLSNYVNDQYNLALSKDSKRNVAFALVILQRRLASSTFALLKSLGRRKNRLEEVLSKSVEISIKKQDIEDIEDVEDLSEDDRWKEESEWETVSVAETKDEIKKEISKIEELITLASDIIKNEEEVKLKKLKESLNELSKEVEDKSKRKILIFTESRDTLDYLENKIKEWGYAVNTIHGGMKLEDRINAEAVFKNETEILIATEAAGEGINLQFCNLMINYDIPWNPNRLEQRMGRIHRYGQTREVFVNNLVATDTREGKVLNALLRKLDEIKIALGNEKVFDIIGEIIDSREFSKAITDAAVNARDIDEILKSIDIEIDEKYIEKVKENLGESLATSYIDYTFIKEMAQQAKEQRLIPEYTQNYFIMAFEKAGGKVKITKTGLIAIDSIPVSIKNIAEDESFKKQFGMILKSYPKITFDKTVLKTIPTAEFVSFGHPLFEAVIQWIERDFVNSLLIGATFYDPDKRLNGFIFFFEGEIKDGTGSIAGKRIFSYFANENEIIPISPTILWDLVKGKPSINDTTVDIESVKNSLISINLKSLEDYRMELLKERKRQADIKQKYGIKSLEYLILKLDGELIDLEERKLNGENVDLVIHNKKESKTAYERTLPELKSLIDKEQSLTMSTPKFICAIRVKPIESKLLTMSSDKNIEEIGMKITMEYEQKQGRIPEDVSSQNLGFDIRSKDPYNNTIRYIEVKARAEVGAIALTQNEWFKALRFGNEYFLYVIYNASKNPELLIIPNPAETIKPEQKIEIVRYIVNGDEIYNKGLRV